MASTAIWIAAGITAISGAAAYVYLRKRNNITQQTTASSSTTGTTSRGLRMSGLKRLTRERKMVFVVNRPILSNKQTLFTGVSTACLRYYRSIINSPDYYDQHVKPWTRTGQMKVVLKANSGEELKSLLDRCRAEGIEAVLLNVGDLNVTKMATRDTKGVNKSSKSSQPDQDPTDPAILCVLAPTEKLDRITGHLKLL